MLDADKKEFATICGASLKAYRVEPDADVMRLYWNVLAKYSMEQVRAGFSAFVGNRENRFSITPAHIVDAIESSIPDGRPGADEAWAMYPHHESESAVITDEMAEAMGVARGQLEDGDKNGARMAFRDAYNRIVDRNKANGINARWFPSLGTDPALREQALSKAVSIGRIGQDHALSLLPPKGDANSVGEMLMLADKSLSPEIEMRAKHHERVAALREKFGWKSAA